MYKKSDGQKKLLIVGEKIFPYKELNRQLRKSNFKKDIIFKGRCESEELHLLLAASEALVFVSHFEGFGVPLLEAMHCEIPILASNRSSIPEIAGRAAIYVDPDNPAEIAQGIREILHNTELRNTLIEEGKLNRLRYNWDHSAEKLWEAMMQTIKMDKDA
jgi:glycosyltransferase involved in cell wall biosynthesis